MANIEGKATAITVITPVKPWGRRSSPWSSGPAAILGHAEEARAAVVHPLRPLGGHPRASPTGGAASGCTTPTCSSRATSTGPGTRTSTPSPRSCPARMKAIWGTSHGFPGPLPVEPFKAYIRRNEYVANHFWSAYPGAATTEIIAADAWPRRSSSCRRAPSLGPPRSRRSTPASSRRCRATYERRRTSPGRRRR